MENKDASMTVEDLQKRKALFEKQLADLWLGFEKDTGLVVSEFNPRLDVRSGLIHEPKKRVEAYHYVFSVEVKLP